MRTAKTLVLGWFQVHVHSKLQWRKFVHNFEMRTAKILVLRWFQVHVHQAHFSALYGVSSDKMWVTYCPKTAADSPFYCTNVCHPIDGIKIFHFNLHLLRQFKTLRMKFSVPRFKSRLFLYSFKKIPKLPIVRLLMSGNTAKHGSTQSWVPKHAWKRQDLNLEISTPSCMISTRNDSISSLNVNI